MITLLIFHYISDFLLQTRYVAKNKSSSLKVLSYHILIIFLVLWLGSFFVFKDIKLAFLFSLINAISHFFIDLVIWRSYAFIKMVGHHKKLRYYSKEEYTDFFKDYKWWEDSTFFNFIGLDQLLHIMCLYIIYINIIN